MAMQHKKSVFFDAKKWRVDVEICMPIFLNEIGCGGQGLSEDVVQRLVYVGLVEHRQVF